jgi:hypothetical protein
LIVPKSAAGAVTEACPMVQCGMILGDGGPPTGLKKLAKNMKYNA